MRQAVAVGREIVEIGRDGARNLAGLEAAEAVADVRGIADLAHLAVAHDIDPRRALSGNHIADGRPHGLVERVFVAQRAPILREEDIDDALRPGQAADVRGEDPIPAVHPPYSS